VNLVEVFNGTGVMEGHLEPACGRRSCSWLVVIVLTWEPPEAGVWRLEPQLVGGDSSDLRAAWSRCVDGRSRSWLVVVVRGWVWLVYPPVGRELSL